MLERVDTNLIQPEQDQDTYLMPKGPEVIPQASPDTGAKQVPSDQGDTEILEDKLEADLNNISFYGS